MKGRDGKTYPARRPGTAKITAPGAARDEEDPLGLPSDPDAPVVEFRRSTWATTSCVNGYQAVHFQLDCSTSAFRSEIYTSRRVPPNNTRPAVPHEQVDPNSSEYRSLHLFGAPASAR